MLRVKKDQKIILFNNTGYEFHGRIIKNIDNKNFEIFLEKKFLQKREKSEVGNCF